jgi:hypothetical protein
MDKKLKQFARPHFMVAGHHGAQLSFQLHGETQIGGLHSRPVKA